MKVVRKIGLFVILPALVLAVVGYGAYRFFLAPNDPTPAGISLASLESSSETSDVTQNQARQQETSSDSSEAETEVTEEEILEPVQTVATNLDVPWEIVFLSDDSYLVTERPGRLIRIYPDQNRSIPVEGVVQVGEGGLQGMVLHPDYAANNFVYLYLTSRNPENNQLINRVERYTFDEVQNTLGDRQIIIDNIPGAQYHDGGRIDFGPDDYLYIGTGDATEPSLAQNEDSLGGKILRLTDTGQIPEDNPFGNAVYSLGHRNVQGFAWDDAGQLWATEHGPSGVNTGNDELNLITAGSNYGWPDLVGQDQQAGFVSPVIESGDGNAWAPGGAEIVGDSLFFAGLRGSALYETTIQGQELESLVAHFKNEFGRLRFVQQNGDWLYVGTSNTDGRGTAQQNDDKIIRIHLSVFE